MIAATFADAQVGSSIPPPPPRLQPQQILKPGSAQILGKVVEAGTSSGVAGAQVVLSGASLGGPTSVFTDGTAGGSRRVLTDGQGQFLFRDVPVGSYTMSSTAAGYIDGTYGETRIIQIRRGSDLIRPLEIVETDRTVSARIQMWRTGGISGAVLDEAGEPMAGAQVNVLARMTDWAGPLMQMATTLTADDRGVYHADIVPGDYIVGLLSATTTIPDASVAGFQQAVAEGGASLSRFMSEMQASGGLIARGAGVRVGSFWVSQRATNNLSALPPLLSLNGRVMLHPSTYHPSALSATSATVVSVRSGEEKTGIDIRVPLIEARRVSGQVVSSSGPVPGVTVTLVAPDPALARSTPAMMIDTPQAMTDGNGSFSLIGVAPGPYTVKILRPASAAGARIGWAADSITVPADADLTDVQIALHEGARVSGRIVVESTSAKAPTAAELTSLIIVTRPVAGTVGALLDSPRIRTDRPDPTRFVTAEVPPGAYMMSVTVPVPGFVLKSVTAAGQNIVDKPFDLPQGGLSDVVVTITDQVSVVTGIARDDAGKPAPTATVAVFPADRSLWRLPGMPSRRVVTMAPGRDGRYTFRSLPAGDYIVVAADWPSVDFFDNPVLTRLMPFGTKITIADGESRTQDLVVKVIR